MTLDTKALEAAARRLAKDAGHDPDGCHFGHGSTGPGGGTFVCDVKYWESFKGTAAAAIEAYLSVASPRSILEEAARVAARDKLARDLWLHSAMFDGKAAHWDTPGLMLEIDRQPYFDLADAAIRSLAKEGVNG